MSRMTSKDSQERAPVGRYALIAALWRDGLNTAEIADRLKLTEAAVHNSLRDALQMIPRQKEAV